LQDEVSKPVHRQRSGVELAKKRVFLDRPPDPFAAISELRTEFL
jgi:hypothetical protein